MTAPIKDFLHSTFSGLSEVEMRERGLEAIRLFLKDRNVRHGYHHGVDLTFWFRELVGQWIRIRQSGSPDVLDVSRVLQAVGHGILPSGGVTLVEPHQMRVLEFWQWMEQARYAIRCEGQAWALTPAGMRRLQSEHPCGPRALERLRAAYVPEFEDSIARLEDAHECFERALWRPAIMLLGLAYEDMLIIVAGKHNVKAHKAIERIAKLRQVIENQPKSDPREAALGALNIADRIRDERNTAAHKASSTFDATDVDELLTLGMQFFHKLAGYVA